jgi:RHS repeat-associated protein
MYAPYGRLIDNNGPDNASNRTDPHNNLTWAGKPWDKETELNYFGARDYDSTAGVWTTQDPYRGQLAEPMTLHRYGYVGDNPVNWVDPNGYCPWCVLAIAGGVVGAATNVGAQLIGDVASGQWSDPREYVATAIGGAIGGATTVLVAETTGCLTCAGAAGGFTGQLTENAVHNLLGLKHVELRDHLVQSTLVGGIAGALSEFAPGIRGPRTFRAALSPFKKLGAQAWKDAIGEHALDEAIDLSRKAFNWLKASITGAYSTIMLDQLDVLQNLVGAGKLSAQEYAQAVAYLAASGITLNKEKCGNGGTRPVYYMSAP